MTDTEIYSQLAARLDAIPNGFPATSTGIELQLLAKIFAPEEARLAANMQLMPLPASEIADRAGVPSDDARRRLKEMVREGLIVAYKGERELGFGLMPFVVGVYEAQLPRIDAEMAELLERYIQETRGGTMIVEGPAVHRVIPVGEAVPFSLEVFPYERATELVEQAQAWGVQDCICRLQQRLIGRGCDHPIESCIVLSPVETDFAGSPTIRGITREECLQILRDAAESGLVHSTGNYRDGAHYICNCCSCCCGVLRGVAEFHTPAAIAASRFRAVIDEELCMRCGTCEDRCPVGAVSIGDDAARVSASHCIGCGLCVATCPTNALQLARRPQSEAPPPPANRLEWMQEKAAQRGLPPVL